MTGYFRMLVAAVALAALPGLSGCLGGGGGSAAPAAQMPREPAPEPMAEPAADPDPAPMAEPAADPDPAPMAEPARSRTSLADLWLYAHNYYQNTRSTLSRGNATFELEFGLGIRYPIENSSMLHLRRDTRNHIQTVSPLSDGSGVRVLEEIPGDEDVPAVTFDSRGGRVFEVTRDKAIFGRVEWDGGDDENWTAWGWWVALRGADFIASAPRDTLPRLGRAGVFAEGPEFRPGLEPDSLPQTGTGRYRGTTAGVFNSEVYAGGWNSGRGFGSSNSSFVGEFTGSADLVMNYGALHPPMTLDIRVNRMEGNWWRHTEPGSGLRPSPHHVVQEFDASGGPAWRFRSVVRGTEKGITGSIRGSFISGGEEEFSVVSGFPAAGTWGTVEGQLSGVPSSGGHPRSAAGVFIVGGEVLRSTPGARGIIGSDTQHGPFYEHRFSGAFLAPLVGTQ